MRILLSLVLMASVGATALNLSEIFVAPVPRELKPVGVLPIVAPDFDRIDAVLQHRAPGWGISLRARVSQAITEEAQVAGLDPLLIVALISVESEFQQDAVSSVGAHGLMQIRPNTLIAMAQREGMRLTFDELRTDPAVQVRLGVRYLKLMKNQFRGDLDSALMAYNAGPTRLSAAAKENAIDQYQGYVHAVRRRFARLKRAHGEVGDWALASKQ